MTPRVTAVVVAYNSADDLRELLPLLAGDPRVEVVVLDNASPDDGLAVVAEHPACRSVAMGSNAGWTAASNAGARLAQAPVLAFVNPDVRVTPDQLVALAARLGPGLASVSPRFVDGTGTPEPFAFRFPTPLAGLFVFLNAGRRIDHWLGSRFVRWRTYADGAPGPQDLDHIGAACLVVDAAVFRQVGEFDERMWLFFSDTDWALRARASGLRSADAPDVRVVHEGGGSVRHVPTRTVETAFQRDYLQYAGKHYSRAGWAVTRVGVGVLVGLLPALAALLRGDRAAARACLAQAREVLR